MMTRRNANPLHGYLASTPAVLLCGARATRKRRALTSLASLGGLDTDPNPCDACLQAARRRQDEFQTALASLEQRGEP